MEFNDVVEKRRSIRKFMDKDVEDIKINQLINCARLCQSSKNKQPWKFMILKEEYKNRIATIMLDLFDEDKTNLPGVSNSVKASAEIIKNAPAIILVLSEDEKEWQTVNLLSIGAAIEHICLEAVNLELGSVWLADVFFTEQEILKYIGYPELRLISAIAVGYPAQSPKARPRKALNEILIEKK